MNMKHIIITGASRGFGKALVNNLTDTEITLHLVARGDLQPVVDTVVRERGGDAVAYEFDLSHTERIPILMEQIYLNIDLNNTESVFLINNAGVLEPIGPVGKHPVMAYKNNLEVNFVAPVILTHQFVHKFQDFKAEKRVIMISSGAADKSYYGWSHYCSTKAGINRFMQVLAVEQKNEKFPVKTIAFNPGMMETSMQEEIRSQDIKDFTAIDKFINAKETGRVGDPEIIARKMVDILWSEEFPDGQVITAADY